MIKNNKNTWSEYYKITKDKPPSKLLVGALNYVKNREKALDIGGGALKETRYLLSEGFEVTVIDSSELMAKEAEKINSAKLHYFVTPFDKFNFPKDTFDIVSAMYSLPFNSPTTFNSVFNKIKKSLVRNGIFCGQLFGIRDQWSNRTDMTFHTIEQAKELFSGMEMIYFKEEEKDGQIANGRPKHWHVFHFITKKI